jgi:hypothetical protein
MALQLVEQHRERKRAQPDGGQLDRQRYAVQAAAQLDHVAEAAAGDGEPGGGRRPAGEQLDRVVLAERADRVHVLARRVERLPAGREDGHQGRVQADRLGQQRAGVEQVLAGVEYQQRRPVTQVVEHRVELRLGILLGQPERGRDRVGEQFRLPQRGQLDQAGTVVIVGLDVGRGPQREPGLAHPARPGHGDQPGAAEGGHELDQLAPPPHESGGVGG